jgi:hypothetical protein
VVGNQIVNFTSKLSFCHNLCYRCPNSSCEPIFDIYTLIVFQWYKKCFNARCFDPYNWTLKFQEFWRTPKSPFRECESHPHTLSFKKTFDIFYNFSHWIVGGTTNELNEAFGCIIFSRSFGIFGQKNEFHDHYFCRMWILKV